MPELPEVETVRRGLQARLKNFCINDLEVCREGVIASPGGSHEFAKMMKGKTLYAWDRRGKYLIASLKENIKSSSNSGSMKSSGWLGVHLRMTGYFQLLKQIIPACPYTRVRFWDSKGSELRFVDIRSFGQMWWVPEDTTPEKIILGLNKLGPEPFSKDFNPLYLEERLHKKTRSIKSALLDQSIVAGVGNIYADESLFKAGISPKTPCGLLKKIELEKLCEVLIDVLKVSIGKGGTTFSDFRDLEGINGNYGGQAWVYGRENMPCRECGSFIKREKLAGRSTHWCPKCQC